MADEKLRVAIIGCGRMGQHYTEVYNTFENTEVVAIAEYNDDRRNVVGERFGVTALFKDAEEMYQAMDEVPDLAVVVLPGKFIKDAVIASAQAGVRGVSTDKPIGAKLSDVDEMIATCEERGAVFHGGNLQRSRADVQEAASWLRNGDYGEVQGATVHGWGGEISGGGCQHIAVLRLLTNAEITEVIAWGKPQESLEANEDSGLIINGRFKMSTGIETTVYGEPTPHRGVDVWTEDSLLRWDWGDVMDIYQGFDDKGARIKSDPPVHTVRLAEVRLPGKLDPVLHLRRRERHRDGHIRLRPAQVPRGRGRRQALGALGLGPPLPAAGGPFADPLPAPLPLARRGSLRQISDAR